MKASIALVLLGALAGCEKSGSKPTEPAPSAAADDAGPQAYTFDGFRLGDSYAGVMAREPYRAPCDDDPVDRAKTVRAMVYGALPCRDHTFPHKTSVIFFFPFVEPDDFDQPIQAFAWLGGDYFDGRSSFPLQPGVKADRLEGAFGPALATFDISDRVPLRVQKHAGGVYAVLEGDVVAGFAVGELPDQPTAGQWDAVEQMYRRYTPRVAAGTLSRADCEALIDRAHTLMKADPEYADEADEYLASRDRKIAQCMAEATPAIVTCARAARTFAELIECDRQNRPPPPLPARVEPPAPAPAADAGP